MILPDLKLEVSGGGTHDKRAGKKTIQVELIRTPIQADQPRSVMYKYIQWEKKEGHTAMRQLSYLPAIRNSQLHRSQRKTTNS